MFLARTPWNRDGGTPELSRGSRGILTMESEELEMPTRNPRRVTSAVALGLPGRGRDGRQRRSPRPRRRPASGHPKAPVPEVLHCPLAFAGVHLLKDMPEVAQVAYHYCKPLNDDVAQCVLYDGTGPDARLIGVEYLVSAPSIRGCRAEEKAYWHDHKYEVDAGLIKSLTQTGDEEKTTLAKVRTLWGKVYHTWVERQDYPRGPARLSWSVTGEEPFVLAPDAKLPPELKAAPGRRADRRPAPWGGPRRPTSDEPGGSSHETRHCRRRGRRGLGRGAGAAALGRGSDRAL